MTPLPSAVHANAAPLHDDACMRSRTVAPVLTIVKTSVAAALGDTVRRMACGETVKDETTGSNVTRFTDAVADTVALPDV